MRGTEADGSASEKWCKLCYLNGQFTGPDCTLDQMIQIVDDSLKSRARGLVCAGLPVPESQGWSAGGRESI